MAVVHYTARELAAAAGVSLRTAWSILAEHRGTEHVVTVQRRTARGAMRDAEALRLELPDAAGDCDGARAA